MSKFTLIVMFYLVSFNLDYAHVQEESKVRRIQQEALRASHHLVNPEALHIRHCRLLSHTIRIP